MLVVALLVFIGAVVAHYEGHPKWRDRLILASLGCAGVTGWISG